MNFSFLLLFLKNVNEEEFNSFSLNFHERFFSPFFLCFSLHLAVCDCVCVRYIFKGFLPKQQCCDSIVGK